MAPCDRLQSVTSAEAGYVSELGKGRRNGRSPGGHAWKERKRAFLKYRDNRLHVGKIFFFSVKLPVFKLPPFSAENIAIDTRVFHCFFFSL